MVSDENTPVNNPAETWSKEHFANAGSLEALQPITNPAED